jgi:hypothetical protein
MVAFVIGAHALGCTASSDAGPTTTDADEIVSVPQTDVERQSIGTSWIYAQATWVESMHKAATGEAFVVSRAYWTYWHWFDQIASGTAAQLATGGNWMTANGIARKYGLAPAASFLAGLTDAQMSARQASALAALNDSLANGVLSTSVARHTKVLVRAELDRAWGLPAEVSLMLNQVFGDDAARTFTSSSSVADPAGTPIQRVDQFAVAYSIAPGQPSSQKHLADAMNEWHQIYYSSADRRTFQQRVQRALMAVQPVIMTWFVDFDALENRAGPLVGAFNMGTLNELGPGTQGGHATVIQDTQVKLADGRVLEAGKPLDPTKPADKTLLDEALMSNATVEFLRVKNSWGAAHPERAFSPGMPDYHDLYFDYLDGPVKKCVVRGTTTDTQNCPTTTTPLQNVVLPPGY